MVNILWFVGIVFLNPLQVIQITPHGAIQITYAVLKKVSPWPGDLGSAIVQLDGARLFCITFMQKVHTKMFRTEKLPGPRFSPNRISYFKEIRNSFGFLFLFLTYLNMLRSMQLAQHSVHPARITENERNHWRVQYQLCWLD